MKAVILAGGRGTRGRPYTDYFPKAMIPVDGRPLIDHVARHLRSYEFIDKLVIISDFAGLGGQIRNYFGDRDGITYVQDSQSGTAGDLLHAQDILEEESGFVLWFVDNLCAVDLEGMKRQFESRNSEACIATRSRRREETGFVSVRDDGTVTEFREKPTLGLQMPECLGIYMLGGGIMERIKMAKEEAGDGAEINLSYDILQQISGEGRVSAFDIGDSEWIDAESPTVLERNRRTVAEITRRMGS